MTISFSSPINLSYSNLNCLIWRLFLEHRCQHCSHPPNRVLWPFPVPGWCPAIAACTSSAGLSARPPPMMTLFLAATITAAASFPSPRSPSPSPFPIPMASPLPFSASRIFPVFPVSVPAAVLASFNL